MTKHKRPRLGRTFVETHDYVRAEEDSPTGEGYHEFKNGETYFLIGNALGEGMMKLVGPQAEAKRKTADARVKAEAER
jgi:hypothetical protein